MDGHPAYSGGRGGLSLFSPLMLSKRAAIVSPVGLIGSAQGGRAPPYPRRPACSAELRSLVAALPPSRAQELRTGAFLTTDAPLPSQGRGVATSPAAARATHTPTEGPAQSPVGGQHATRAAFLPASSRTHIGTHRFQCGRGSQPTTTTTKHSSAGRRNPQGH